MSFKINMQSTVFYLGVGVLFAQEMDAIINDGWQFLPVINGLPEQYGQILFFLLHIPFFAILVALIASENSWVRTSTHFGVAGFLILRGLSHFSLMSQPEYPFSSLLSHTLLFGGAVCGLLYCALKLKHAVSSLVHRSNHTGKTSDAAQPESEEGTTPEKLAAEPDARADDQNSIATETDTTRPDASKDTDAATRSDDAPTDRSK